MASKQFTCPGCAAQFEFDPSASTLKCPYCGNEKEMPKAEEDIRELDFAQWAKQAEESAETAECITVKCEACGAESTFDPNVTSEECAFCGTNIVVQKSSKKGIKPKAVLPFKVSKDDAYNLYKKWILGLWFAPNALKKQAYLHENLNGMYIPYWTYDSNTTSFYRGERGEDYYETETYTETDAQGKTQTKTRKVKKTRWYSVSGWVYEDFDDILVLASKSLPKRYADALEPWDIENINPYADEYVVGFRTESYQVTLQEGFEEARKTMDSAIRESIKRHIGGDHQRIHAVRTQYDGVTFKHILLPIWIAAYLYRNKSFRFLVNARTGEVQGERPWSVIKIVLAVLAVLAVVSGIVVAVGYFGG